MMRFLFVLAIALAFVTRMVPIVTVRNPIFL